MNGSRVTLRLAAELRRKLREAARRVTPKRRPARQSLRRLVVITSLKKIDGFVSHAIYQAMFLRNAP